jgi:flavin-dependent dehydrogenase
VGDERDIVIVGGGPAGTTTALALVHALPALARRVVLLEKARYPRDKPCAGALGARGDALLGSIGIKVPVPAVSIDGMSFRGAEGAAAPGRIGRVVRRVEFDHALARLVAARGVEVRDGVQVDRVREQGEGAQLETSHGVLSARAVVGCDGVGSVVRKALGAAPAKLRAQVIEVDTDPVAGDGDRSLLHFDASDRRYLGYSWDFPTLVDGQELVCRGVYRLKMDGHTGTDEEGGADIGELLAARLHRQGLDITKCTKKRYAERGYESATTVARGPLMLVGEAVGIDPVTGEGIAQAIEYGILAGRFLARCAGGATPEPLHLDGWAAELRASRLAHDLRIRGRFARFYTGPARSEVERFFAESPDALFIGCQHFAAQPHDWVTVAEVAARGGARLLAMKIGQWLGAAGRDVRRMPFTAPTG